MEIGGESENLGKSGRSSCEWENIPFSRRCFYEKILGRNRDQGSSKVLETAVSDLTANKHTRCS